MSIHSPLRWVLERRRSRRRCSSIMHARYSQSISLCLVLVGGCAANSSRYDAASQRKLLSLLMPSRIEIVEPFTRVKSFDNDSTPDGIEVLLQAVNSLDNAGLMIVGDLRIELYEYVLASGDQKGRRLEYWQVPLATSEDQRTYWNRVTQMYELQLSVDSDIIPSSRRYVLAVVYNSPLGEHLTDECIIEYNPAAGPMGQTGTANG